MFLALLAVPTIAQIFGEPFYIRLFTRIMILGLAAVSLDLILGYGGMVSLGHAAYVGVGAYVVGILSFHADNGTLLLGLIPGSQNAFIVWPVGVLVAGLMALLVGLVSLRTSGVYFIMITLAFAQMLYFFFVSLQTYGGDDGLQLSQMSWPLDNLSRSDFYYVVFAALALSTFFVTRVVGSRFGMVLRGARQNDRRLRSVGFPTFQYRLAAYVLSGAIAGLAGVLLANSQQFVSPGDMSWDRSAQLIVEVVLGGMATVHGAILGTVIYELLQLILGSYTVHWQVIFGPFFILVVLILRRGFFSLAFGSDRDA